MTESLVFCRTLSHRLVAGVEISCRICKPRRPRESPLYRLVEQHLEELLRVWPDRFVRQHRALRPVVVEERMGDRFLLVTQNNDGLHQRAGSRCVIESTAACSGPAASTATASRSRTAASTPCRRSATRARRAGAKGRLRPAVVWFGEMIDPSVLRAISRFLDEARRPQLAFLAVGTSGAVYPAAGLVVEARAAGGETWLVNAEPAENRGAFHPFVQGPSGTILPDFFEWS